MKKIIFAIVGFIVSLNISGQTSGGQIRRKPTTAIRSSHNKNSNNGNLYAKTGVHNGYDYVDLGLSVRWATCNLGASTPEKFGDCYAWGETISRTIYG